jgi:putative nucleotidyltransferase with HDIG domain
VIRRRLGVVGVFALWSAVVLAVFTVVITLVATRQIEGLVVTSSAKSMAAAVNGMIVHTLSDEQLHALRTTDLTQFDSVIADSIKTSDIRAVKIWNRENTVVYSSFDKGEVGRVYPDYENLRSALDGDVVWNADTGDKDESRVEAEAFGGDVVEVYAPIQSSPGGEVFGVFEVYQNYTPVRGMVVSSLVGVWGISALAAILLYVVQLRIVMSAAVRLKQSEAEAVRVNERLEDSLRDLEEHSVGTLQALTSAVDAKDSYTARHSLGVTDYAVAAGRHLGLDDVQIASLERAALLHDIGKIGTAEAILLKPRQLTREEYLAVQEHSDMGASIIESIPFLKDLVPIVRHHHERWDGGGYPDGLSGENIPRLARVLSVADAYDAMTSDRPYRRAMKVGAAREELERGVGTQFDPAVVTAFVACIESGECGSRSDMH